MNIPRHPLGLLSLDLISSILRCKLALDRLIVSGLVSRTSTTSTWMPTLHRNTLAASLSVIPGLGQSEFGLRSCSLPSTYHTEFVCLWLSGYKKTNVSDDKLPGVFPLSVRSQTESLHPHALNKVSIVLASESFLNLIFNSLNG
jgi:hypothetical protein